MTTTQVNFPLSVTSPYGEARELRSTGTYTLVLSRPDRLLNSGV